MEKKNQMVNMRYPARLLEKIDAYKEYEGYATRSEAVFALLRKGLEKTDTPKK